jgi:hypothetical protein
MKFMAIHFTDWAVECVGVKKACMSDMQYC